MIAIAGTIIHPAMVYQYATTYIERQIISILSSSTTVYEYYSMDELLFELRSRNSIVNAAILLNQSDLSFAVWENSTCNPYYWIRTNQGGLLVRYNVKPSNAIRDIYINSSQYSTECSTAMLIVYYKAFVDILPKELFNILFSDLYLYDWAYDKDLDIIKNYRPTDYLLGDCMYFRNPDVDPANLEYIGENTIYLGDGLFYGHGIGIKTQQEIINELNKYRKTSSTVSAYLDYPTDNPNYKSLAAKYFNYMMQIML